MSYFKRFLEWQNYVHYILLTIGVVVWIQGTQFIIDILNEKICSINSCGMLGLTIPLTILNFFVAIFVIDSIVHAIFWFLPKPFQWRD